MATTVSDGEATFSNRSSERSINQLNLLSSARRGHRESLAPDTPTYQRRGSRGRGSKDDAKTEQETNPEVKGKFSGLKRHPRARVMLTTVTSLAVSRRRARNRIAQSREGVRHKPGELGAVLKKQVSQITLIRRNMKELHMHAKSRFKNPGEVSALLIYL
jgi:hypothetical protein